jgi:hypothetical protein
VNSFLDTIKGLFRRAATSVEETRDGLEPVATAAPGSDSDTEDDDDRETSTNAQLEGSVDEPWSGNT